MRAPGEARYEARTPSEPPAPPDRWEREAPSRPPEAAPPRAIPTVELPAELATEVRRGLGGLTETQRERMVDRLAQATDAYNRGRYEEAARRIAPVAEAVPLVSAVRELAGLANYRARRWRAAAAHLRAYTDLSGDASGMPALMDAERALGRPRAVRALYDEVVSLSPSAEVLSEARIVAAGTLADRGRLEEALQLLVTAGAARKVRNPAERHIRLWYALADLYERTGDVARARELFRRVADADPSAYDVDERLDDLGGAAPRTRARPKARPKVGE